MSNLNSILGRIAQLQKDPMPIQHIKRHECHAQAMLSLHDAKKFLASICESPTQLEEYLNDQTDDPIIRDPLKLRKGAVKRAQSFADDFWGRSDEYDERKRNPKGFDQEAFEREVDEELRREAEAKKNQTPE